MTSDLHFEILPTAQRKVWNSLKEEARRLSDSGFCLAGGTALALQIGHRRSVDFDFFSVKKGQGEGVRAWLETLAGVTLREADAETVHADFNGVKISFIGAYRYPFIGKVVNAGGIHLANVLDIALMKLLAITHRATLRDYLDLAVIIRDQFPLAMLIEKSRKKYGRAFNPMLVLRALVTFDDVDIEKPYLIDKSLSRTWEKILTKAVKKTVL